MSEPQTSAGRAPKLPPELLAFVQRGIDDGPQAPQSIEELFKSGDYVSLDELLFCWQPEGPADFSEAGGRKYARAVLARHDGWGSTDLLWCYQELLDVRARYQRLQIFDERTLCPRPARQAEAEFLFGVREELQRLLMARADEIHNTDSLEVNSWKQALLIGRVGRIEQLLSKIVEWCGSLTKFFKRRKR